jgi:hypothetical protein
LGTMQHDAFRHHYDNFILFDIFFEVKILVFCILDRLHHHKRIVVICISYINCINLSLLSPLCNFKDYISKRG